jgi:hypothetical protein
VLAPIGRRFLVTMVPKIEKAGPSLRSDETLDVEVKLQLDA